jgi:hypothetical protein
VQQLTWWHQLSNGWGGSDYATINIKERRQKGACCLGRKWRHNESTGGISFAMVGVSVRRRMAMLPMMTMQR